MGKGIAIRIQYFIFDQSATSIYVDRHIFYRTQEKNSLAGKYYNYLKAQIMMRWKLTTGPLIPTGFEV